LVPFAEGFAARYHQKKSSWTAFVRRQDALLKALDPSNWTEKFEWFFNLKGDKKKQALEEYKILKKELNL